MIFGGNSTGIVSDWYDIVAVSAGMHTVGLRANGTVVADGLDVLGSLEVSDWYDIIAVSAGGFHTLGLKSDGTAVATHVINQPTMVVDYGQSDVSHWSDIVAVSAGSFHSVGLRADGTVVAVGSGQAGQLDVSGWYGIKVP